MIFSIQREILLKPLQLICNVSDKKHNKPILANVLMRIENDILYLVGSDLEVELTGIVRLPERYGHISFTLPARKLNDICKSLPEQATLKIEVSEADEKVKIISGKSKFLLLTLPVADFPNIEGSPGDIELTIKSQEFKQLIDSTQFSMASNDVRYYLNGLLLKLNNNQLISVGTDGHRLALSEAIVSGNFEQSIYVIVPRKGVSELARLLTDNDLILSVAINKNHITVTGNDFVFTSKLVDGRFPDYLGVFPKNTNSTLLIDKNELKQAVSRTAILSNEKNKGVLFTFSESDQSMIRLSATNPEQEEAEEIINAQYQGESTELAFNASYLLDILNVLPNGLVKITFAERKSSVLFESEQESNNSRYIIMPLQI